MTPEEMQAWLDKARNLAKKGYAPDKISAWLASRTKGQFTSGQQLASAIIEARKTAEPPKEPSKFTDFRQAGRANDAALLQGLTSGFFDEMKGALASGVGGAMVHGLQLDKYRAVRDEERALAAQAGAGPEIAGGALQGLLTLPVAGAITGAGYLGNVATGALGGGLLGGLYGAGKANEMSDVPGQAASGAKMGALVGGGVAAAVPPLAAVGRWGKDWLNVLRGKESTLQNIADMQVGTSFGAGQVTPDQALQPLDRAVELQLPMTVPADASANVARLGRRSINAAPNLSDVAEEVAASRAGLRAPALVQGLARETGVPEDVATKFVQGRQKELRDVAKAIYKPLEGTTVDASTGIPQVLDALAAKDPEVATQIARIANRQPDQPLTFEVVQSIQQHLANRASAAWKTPGERAIAKALGDAAKTLEAEMAANIPGYAGASAKYAQALQVRDAYAMGAKTATGVMSDADLAAYNALSDEAKQAWKMGKQYATSQKINASDPTKPSAPFRYTAPANAARDVRGVGDPTRMGWLNLFPDQASAQNFDDMVRLGRRQVSTEGKLLGGSHTAQDLTDLQNGFTQKVAKAGGSGPQSVRAAAWREALDALLTPQREKLGNMVGQQLLAPYTPEARAQIVRQMELAATAKQRRGLFNLLLEGALTGGGNVYQQSP